MSPPSSNPSSLASAGSDGFAATHWTVVMAAAQGSESSRATAAMTELCRTYWYPLYAYLRRRGQSTHDAEDITQAFIARLLAPEFLMQVDRGKGRFRAFLLASLKNFLADEMDRARAQKRGGDQVIIALDGLAAEARYRLEPAHDLTPERLYARQWALSVLDHVLHRLEHESTAAGKAALFAALKPTLTDANAARYAVIGSELGLTEGAVKAAAYRLRRRYRELLLQEIAQTVSGPDEVEEEIHYLMSCL